jgi:hypothetical protein
MFTLSRNSYDEAMASLEQRKAFNASNMDLIAEYCPYTVEGAAKCLVRYDDVGNIKSCLCMECWSKIDRSPVYNSKFVYPLCKECLMDIEHIENTDKKGQTMKTNSKKNDITKINFDWVEFEKMMASGTAKLVALADTHNVYPIQLRQAIIAKYGDQVTFKKGRYGGIIWTSKTIG